MRLTTNLLDPGRAAAWHAMPPSLRQQVPADYVELLTAYGPGTYCGEVVIAYPDATTIPATFGEQADLWELDERFTAADLLVATQLGWSSNGDIVCVTPSQPGQVFVLPRHAELVSSWPTFSAAVALLVPPAPDEPYYDPAFEAVVEQLSLVRNGQLLPIELVWQAFRQQFTVDFVVRADTQPLCVLKGLGGWVSFDLVYKNTITVKYQRTFAAQAAAVLAFLRQHLP